ncbi:OTU domain-containing 2 [Lecanosticta acicola]|uniref:OTU domain-containing 2 n=1 Tax=Lecanosticta acicola TaxID=111012 RepID=A0AAI8W0B2_9PEZI|nr:OTU domain-containing 2 [Lecanosticta acicola]
MEALQTRHRKEQRDLQSRVTQKKKQASKKTRKGVNEECERLEAELKERQEREVRGLNGEVGDGEGEGDGDGGDVPIEELEDLTLKIDNEDEAREPVSPPAGVQDNSSSPSQQPQTAAKKRNRQKDRLARRAAEQEHLSRQAAEEAKNLPDLKQQERTRMLAAMASHNLIEREIRADGHCLYSAIADQLSHLSIPLPDEENPAPQQIAYRSVRARAADYIAAHPEDFAPFLEEPLADYVHKVRDTGEWGGQLELMALAKTYGTDINVLQDFGRVERIESGCHNADDDNDDKAEEKAMWLGYYKHGFGLGEHYNSLRRRKVP